MRRPDVTWSEDPHEAERVARLALQVLERVIREDGDSEAMAGAYFDAAWLHSALGDQERAIACAGGAWNGSLTPVLGLKR